MTTTHPVFTYWRAGDFGSRQGLTSYWRDRIKEDPEWKHVVMCVELVFGRDRVVRVSTAPCEVTSTLSGETVAYRPIMVDEPEIEFSASPGQAGQTRSVSLSIPNELVDAYRAIGAGRMLAGIGEISLNVDGGDYDQRLVLMRGVMTGGVSFGDTTADTVNVTLTDPRQYVSSTLQDMVVTTDRYPNAPDSSIGEGVPVVVNKHSYVPCVPVDDGTGAGEEYAVARGHGWTVSAVYVNTDTVTAGDAEFAWTDVETTDEYGQPVTVLRFSGDHAEWDWSEEVYATITGGLYATRIAPVMRYLLEQYTNMGPSALSAEMFALAEVRLGTMQARACYNTGGGRDGVISYVEQNYLKSFPMLATMWGLGGAYGPVVFDRRDDPVANLTAEKYPIIGRLTGFTETPSEELFNEFLVRYDYNAMDDTYQAEASRDSLSSDLCRLSADSIGSRAYDTIESAHITDSRVAEYIVDWLVEHKTLTSYYGEYEALPWVMLYLRVGQNIELTDEEIGWSDARASVERIVYRGGVITLGLRVWFSYYPIGGAASTGGGSAVGGIN